MRIDERQAFFFETFPRVCNVDPAEAPPDPSNGPVGTSRAKILPPTAQRRTTDGVVQGGFATLDFADVFGRAAPTATILLTLAVGPLTPHGTSTHAST